ncbi:MAG: MBL fold metallo-hydrolase [Desulfomonilaceae bacterium]|nr:MBL fold metallo-hydrolase [Desulfomonilaceae bacterium]
MIKVTCFGAARSVTGSNFLIETAGGGRVLIDCGLFQGGKQIESRNRLDWGYDPTLVDTLILTHAHIDHSGRIPKIVKDGFRGRIIASPPTAELCEVMLLDSAHVQEMDAEWQTRKNRRRARRQIEPLYTTEDAEESLKYLHPVELDKVFDIEPGIKARLRDAGHILGSCSVELWIEDSGTETKVVFSGDLGRQDQPLVNEPFKITEADYLFIESTYGDRRHRDFEASKIELLEAIHYGVSRGEKVIIPAFALERTQELLYVLGEFHRDGKLPDIPIFLDSPLAIKATEIFHRNSKYFDAAAQAIIDQGFDPLGLPNLRFTRTTKESMEINNLSGPAIVISANGMCTAGRIKHHLKHNLWRPGACIIITGFQAEGTTGRQIVDGAKTVKIFGEPVAVRARVYTIGGVSAHADQADLLKWVGNFTGNSTPRVFVVHGEAGSSEAFAQVVSERFGLDVYVPRRGEVLELDPTIGVSVTPAEEVPVEVGEIVPALFAEIEAEISQLKEALTIRTHDVTDDMADKLREVLEELKSLSSA